MTFVIKSIEKGYKMTVKQINLLCILLALFAILWVGVGILNSLDSLNDIEYSKCVNAMSKVGDKCERGA